MRIKWGRIGLVAAAWAAVALFFSLQNVVGYTVRREEVDWVRAVGVEFLYWVPWALLTPALLALSRKHPLKEDVWRRNAAVHGVAALVVAAVQVALYQALQYPVYRLSGGTATASFVQQAAAAFPVLVLTGFWKYWVFVGLWHAFDNYRKYRDREVRSSRLEAQLSEARLRALEMQIRPHFLFNTLHSISMLNLTDVDAANRILVKLSRLLRETLEIDARQEIPLVRELEILDRYLELESFRLGDRLGVRVEVSEDAEDALVPALVLQPLVENAIRHGLEPRSGPGRLTLRVRRVDGTLALDVVDDGRGLPEGWRLEANAGTGLRNTAERIEHLYGGEGSLRVTGSEAGGTVAEVRIPFRTDVGDGH